MPVTTCMACSFPPSQRNCWTLAEAANARSPDGLQRLLSKSVWEHERLRALVEAQIYATLASSTTYWDLDETGFLKAGRHSAGVQHQYTGTAGKQTNCQIAVFLAFSSDQGYALTDFRLYLPKAWAEDPARCEQAGIPPETACVSKAALGIEMLASALDQGYSADWTTGDCIYGDSPDLRQFLVQRSQGFVLALYGKRLCQPLGHPKAVLIREGAELVETWTSFPFPGSQGPFTYTWGQLAVTYQGLPCWVIYRRQATETTAYLAWSPRAFSLHEVAQAICRRWDVERCFEEAKQEVGLAEYQVRKWQSVHRHVTLAMAAFWFLMQLKLKHNTSLPQARRYWRIPWQARPLEAAHYFMWARFRDWHTLKTAVSKWRKRLNLALKPAPA